MFRVAATVFFTVFAAGIYFAPAQETPAVTLQKVQQLIGKKAEYHQLTNGEQPGFRIKIHFGVDRESAKTVRTKFNMSFPDIVAYEEYQQPNFVVLVGDYRTKLEAFNVLQKIRGEYPTAFIVKGKITL